MEIDNEKMNRKYIRAKKRVDQLKGYYGHLTSYILVNIFISAFSIINDMKDGDTLNQALFETNDHQLWLWWGIGIAFHTYGVFGARLLFMNKNWEDKKIKEYMNEK
jgi:hypothetical protein